MATSPLSPDEFRAAAEVYRELGPEYSDAIAESFTEKINREIEARAAQFSRAPHRPRPGIHIVSGRLGSALEPS